MENKNRVFCWHHSDESQLRDYLSQGMVDCPRESLLANNELKPGDRIRISVKIRNEGKGQILAEAELVSKYPHKLNHPRNKSYPFGVYLKNIVLLSGTKFCTRYRYITPPPMNPSHWVE